MADASSGDQELTLDVHYDSAIEWLRDRGKISKQWQKALRTVRAKVDAAMAEARPEVPGVADALRVDYIGFDASRRVVELLRGAGLDRRNILGQYADPHMRRWAAIVSLYERDSLFVVELASRLAHEANYELPAIRKELERTSASLQDAQKKRADALRLADNARERLQAECAALGVRGFDPQSEVRLLVRKLGAVYGRASQELSAAEIGEAVRLYREWTAFCARVIAEHTAPRSCGPGGGSGKTGRAAAGKAVAQSPEAAADAPPPVAPAVDAGRLLPTLARTHGAGHLPDADAATSGGRGGGAAVGGLASHSGATEIEATIDWGGAAAARSASIAGPGASAGIDWGGGDGGLDASTTGGPGAPAEIDWGCGDGGPADSAAVAGAAIEVDGGGAAAGVGDEAGGQGAVSSVDAAIEIDWGGGAASGAGGGGTGADATIEIDWGGDAASGAGGQGAVSGVDAAIEIDWGGGAASGAGGGGTGADAAIEIDWGGGAALGGGDGGGGGDSGIDWGATEDAEAEAEAVIEVEASGEHAMHGGEVEDSGDVRSVYEKTDMRNALIDDLVELEAFLKQRLAEESSLDPILTSALSARSDCAHLQAGADKLGGMLARVCAALAELDCPRTRQLLLIQASDKHADRLASSLQAAKDRVARMELKAEEALDRTQQLEAEKAAFLPRHSAALNTARGLKAELAVQVSALFNGRDVNVMGEVG